MHRTLAAVKMRSASIVWAGEGAAGDREQQPPCAEDADAAAPLIASVAVEVAGKGGPMGDIDSGSGEGGGHGPSTAQNVQTGEAGAGAAESLTQQPPPPLRDRTAPGPGSDTIALRRAVNQR